MKQVDVTEGGAQTQCEAALVAARRLLDSGSPREAESVVRLALAGVSLRVDELNARALLADILYHAGRAGEAAELAEEVAAEASALRMAGRDGASEAELDARQTLAKTALAAGQGERAHELYARYLQLAEDADNPLHISLASGGVGVAAIHAGELSAARSALLRARSLAVQLDAAKPLALAASNLAVLDHLKHDWAGAAAGYAQALDALGRLGNRSSLARAAFNWSELYESLGDLASARRLCRLGEAVAGRDAAPAVRAQGLLLRGRVALAEEAHEMALAAFEAALDLLLDVDRGRASAAQVGCAFALVGLGRVRAAERRLQELPPSMSALRHAEAELARVYCVCARGDDAQAMAERAMHAAREAGDPNVEVRAALAWARALAAAGLRRSATETAMAALDKDRGLEAKVPEASLEAFRNRPQRLRLEQLAAGRTRRATPDQSFELVGRSKAIQEIRRQIIRLAVGSCAVIIEGESGSGKELVATLLVARSERAERPFVRVDCAALPAELIESSLFGHERGAFTDAVFQRRGCFERADGGTLLLDAVDEASPRLQAALLRVLGQGQLRRVGGDGPLEVDVRVLATSRQSLRAMVQRGSFREDLLYRLEGARLILPSLRDRPLDLPVLAEHLLARDAEARGVRPALLTQGALDELGRRSWAGNVRELSNTLRAATLFAEDGRIDAASLPRAGSNAGIARADLDERDLCYRWLREERMPLRQLKKEIERACVMRALEESDGTISVAAALLGMKRPRLSQLVKRYRQQAEEEGI